MIRFLLLSLLMLPATAAELVVRDVRLGLSTLPSSFDFTLKNSTTDTSGSDSFDGGLALDGGMRWSFARPGDSFGLIAGADLAIQGQSYDGGDGLTAVVGKLAGGLGWAATDTVTVTSELLAGYGLSSLSLPATTTAPSFSADGTVLDYELRFTATWLFERRFGVGLSTGWMIASHTLSGDDTDITVDQSGWYVGLMAVWRINDEPPALQ